MIIVVEYVPDEKLVTSAGAQVYPDAIGVKKDFDINGHGIEYRVINFIDRDGQEKHHTWDLKKILKIEVY